MADLVIRVGAHSAQGLRSNNEDRFVADPQKHVFLVADGMGGQDCGEQASGLAAEIIPQVLHQSLAAHEDPGAAVVKALDEANKAIISASRQQATHRRMGTTAVLALQQADRVYVAGLGDSRAYLIRNKHVDQLTSDHTVADALERNGTLTHVQALQSPWRNVLYKFLGCAEMAEGAEVRPLTPQEGDCLVLGSDGLTNHIKDEDLLDAPRRTGDPQQWAQHLVELALSRGSKDNVTCVVVKFGKE
jgi:serine/threonine protein phosphatase PrpC